MGLIVSNRLTDKQRDMLESLDYCGTCECQSYRRPPGWLLAWARRWLW